MSAEIPDDGGEAAQRIDKWLWHARFLKTRTLASKLCSAGRVRVNRGRIKKPSHGVRPGDVLTFPQGRRIRTVRIAAIGARRGPAVEAQALYEDLFPDPVAVKRRDRAPPARTGQRERGAGRPTKAERRAIDALINRGNR